MHNQSTSTRPASLRSPSSYGHNDRSVLPQATGFTVGIAPIGRECVLHPGRGPITLRDQKNRSEFPISDSALEDHHVQVSRAASISAILVRSRSRAGTEMGAAADRQLAARRRWRFTGWLPEFGGLG